MKSLFVLRHAKSDWSSDRLEDFERPLAARGRKDLPRLARVVGRLEMKPQLVLSSSAVRARETAAGLADLLGSGVELRAEERLYLAGPATLSAVLGEQPDTCARIMTVGHNPGLEEWVEHLCGAQVRLPTAGLALLELEIGRWAGVAAGCGRLQWLVVPRLLQG